MGAMMTVLPNEWDGNINTPHTLQDEYELAKAYGVEALTVNDQGDMIPLDEDEEV